MLIYGSQTGTAEEFARRLSRECMQAFGEGGCVIDPDEHDIGTLGDIPENKLVVFVVSLRDTETDS